MDILAVIPARYSSVRLPGKPLALIGGKPMIQLVYESTASSNLFSKVIVATDSELILEAVKKFGGLAEMTDNNHRSGTDRVSEVASRHTKADVIVNVQGDQPFIDKEMLSQLILPYLNGKLPEMTTLCCPLNFESEYNNPHVVKVLCDKHGNAIYFSRAPIPFLKNPSEVLPVYKHIGLYGFSRDFLIRYSKMDRSSLECCEDLEQLRAIEHGIKIHVGFIKKNPIDINTYEDLEQANNI